MKDCEQNKYLMIICLPLIFIGNNVPGIVLNSLHVIIHLVSQQLCKLDVISTLFYRY